MKWMALLLFGGMGLGALIGGLLWGKKRFLLSRNGLPGRGKVIENYKSETTSRKNGYDTTDISYYPVVEFRTRSGETIRFRGSTGSGVPDYEAGAPVDVLYDPEKPHEAQISAFSQFWLGPMVVTIVGLIMFILGVGSFFMIGESDREMDGAQRDAMRSMLMMDPNVVPLAGKITDVQALQGKDAGKYVFVCSAAPQGTDKQWEFRTESFNFDPGREFIGSDVKIFLDAHDQTNYHVNLDPLLPEIVKHQKRGGDGKAGGW